MFVKILPKDYSLLEETRAFRQTFFQLLSGITPAHIFTALMEERVLYC